MKYLLSRLLLVLLLLGTLSGVAFSQKTFEEKRKELLQQQTNTRAEINVLDRRIKTYEQRVNEAENQYDQLYKQFENVNRLLSLRDNKIVNLQKEQSQIQEEISITEDEISLRERELKHLIDNFKEILTYTYKKGRTNNLELLLTSSSINQMLIRSYYLRKLEEQKKKQAEQIQVRQQELKKVKEDLQDIHFKNSLILDEIRQEKLKLSDQQAIQRRNVEKIKQESTNLLAELRRIRQQRENLENNFSNLITELDRLRDIEEERLQRLAEARKIADDARRAEEVAKYSTPTVSSYVSDETFSAMERNFSVSKGKLDWPVNSTTVSRKFGVTRNPLYGTRTEHNGINIVTEPAEDVRAVSDGQVIEIMPIVGYGNVIFVKHGSYYTVYGNLSSINVQKYAVISSGQVIGKAGTQISEMGETIFFGVRKNTTNLNPENWLKPR